MNRKGNEMNDHETVLRREATIIGVDPELPARELLDAIIAWHDGHDPGDESPE